MLIREDIVLKLEAGVNGDGDGDGDGNGEGISGGDAAGHGGSGAGSYIVEFNAPAYPGLYLSFLVAFPKPGPKA